MSSENNLTETRRSFGGVTDCLLDFKTIYESMKSEINLNQYQGLKIQRDKMRLWRHTGNEDMKSQPI